MLDATDMIPFGEWLPDLGLFANPGALTALNCLTEGEKYKPFPDLLENSDALPGICLGGFAYRDAIGNVTIFAGTATTLYKLDGLSWVDVTRLDGAGPDTEPYTTGEDGFWDFRNFGTLVICTNYNDDIQCFDMASSTEFEQLSATAPRCRRIMVLANFLVALDVVDGDGATGYRVSWSPIQGQGGPRGVWTPDPTVTQADKQDLYGGDYSISAGVNILDYGLIIQGKTIWRMQYEGGDKIFSFVPVEQGRGSTVHRSVISDGIRVFYLDESGYFMFLGNQSYPIGNKKIDKTLLKMIDPAHTYNINSSIDARNKVVMMAFPAIGALNGQCDHILIYNWADERFTLIEQQSEVLFTYLSVGYTLEDIDALYADLDSIPFSFDSQYWVGGKTILGAFSQAHKLGSFVGSQKTATIGTPEVRPNSSGKTTLHDLIPYVENGVKQARLGYRDKLSTAPNWTGFVNPNSITDEFNFTIDAIYMRAEVKLSGSWDIAHGVALRAQPSGNF